MAITVIGSGGGIPVGTPTIETGSYVGTGTYGAGNAVSITFSKVPLFVVIYTPGASKGAYANFGIFTPMFLTTEYTSCGYAVLKNATMGLATPTSDALKAKMDGTTLTWYTTRTQYDQPDVQLNYDNTTYNWVAFYAES